MDTITFDDFLKVELRVGRIVSAAVFKEDRRLEWSAVQFEHQTHK